MIPNIKIALVFDDLIQYGGAERLLLDMHEVWPQAPIYTTVASKKWQILAKEKNITLKTSFMQHLPWIEKLNRYYAPFLLHTLAFESFDFSEFNIVISMSARFAHGIITKPKTKHICYMNSPGRMFWEPHDYFKKEQFHKSQFKKTMSNLILEPALSHLRTWDYCAAQRVDAFIANSDNIQRKIKKYYKKESTIIYPCADVEKLTQIAQNQYIHKPAPNDYFLIITRLAAWKRVDLAVEACKQLGYKLKIIGNGPDMIRLKALAAGHSNIELLGSVDDTTKNALLCSCKAVINTQLEDFGIVPIEAMACGKPVIAFGAGGTLETVLNKKTGIFFEEQTTESLIEALRTFKVETYNSRDCITRARLFDKRIFQEKLQRYVIQICQTTD